MANSHKLSRQSIFAVKKTETEAYKRCVMSVTTIRRSLDLNAEDKIVLLMKRNLNKVETLSFLSERMSWQNFVDESLLGTSQVARASIHGLDGTRYASSTGFVVLPSEAQALLSGITKDPTPFFSKGIAISRTKYVFVRSDPGHAIYCCKGNEGAVAVKTNKCLLIGGYSDGMQAGCCSAVMEKLADYFIAIGY